MKHSSYSDFDTARLSDALNAKRNSLHLSENKMMHEINRVNNQLHLVPMTLSTVKNLVRNNDTTCQGALHMLRWLGKTPESFLIGSKVDETLPFPAEGRLYWSMQRLATAVKKEKEKQGLTWEQLAEKLCCTQNQISGLHKRTYGISIHLAMRITQWLGRKSEDFIAVLPDKPSNL